MDEPKAYSALKRVACVRESCPRLAGRGGTLQQCGKTGFGARDLYPTHNRAEFAPVPSGFWIHAPFGSSRQKTCRGIQNPRPTLRCHFDVA